MKTVTPAMAAHLASETTTLATCWTITRTDGVVFRYTTHDADVQYAGETYKSAAGFDRSAMKSSANFAVDELEVTGLLRDDGITDEEMRNGAFDYAQVEVFLVNYEDQSMGRILLRTGYFAEVRTNDQGIFTVELRGLVDQLQNKIGNTYLPECRVDLGSEDCGVKLKPTAYERGKKYAVGDRMIYPVLQPDEDDARYFNDLVDPETATGWRGGSIIAQDLQMVPRTGSHALLVGGWSSSSIYFTPEELGLTAAEIAANNLKIVVTGYYYFYWTTSSGYVSMSNQSRYFNTDVYLDIGGAGASVDLPNERPERIWRKFEMEMDVSPSTARFRVTVGCNQADKTTAMGFDDMTFAIMPRDQPEPNFATYGGIEFEAQTEGKTSLGLKEFPSQIGETVVDGDVTWKAVVPKWTFLGSVTELHDKTTIVIGTPVTAVSSDFFENGVLTWVSGKNAGRACEVVSYDSSTGKAQMALPFPYQPQIGDVFSLQVGCNKDHQTCRVKYDNLLNFRGHPRVPGNGLYFKVAGL